MDDIYILLIILICIGGVFLFLWIRKQKKNTISPTFVTPPSPIVVDKKQDSAHVLLRLQAYERLILLSHRMSLPYLLSVIPASSCTVIVWQLAATQKLKEEFDFNLSQQIYVSELAWETIKNLKMQTQLLIYQQSNHLDASSDAHILTQKLSQQVFANQYTFHETAIQFLSQEARKIIGVSVS